MTNVLSGDRTCQAHMTSIMFHDKDLKIDNIDDDFECDYNLKVPINQFTHQASPGANIQTQGNGSQSAQGCDIVLIATFSKHPI